MVPSEYNPQSRDALLAAEHAWVQLKLYVVDRPPFIAGLAPGQQAELCRLCWDLAMALAALPGKE